MTKQELVHDQTICARKEPRYKSSEESPLKCETTLATCGLRRGTVIDLSNSGARLLCEGTFEVGQSIFTELTTDRSHGIYRGVIRRVEPWVGGQSVLGCSLEEQIPDAVLQELANDGAINRHTDDRIQLSQQAKLSWPLSQKEIDVQLRDFSSGGMKIVASAPIPENVRLRFRVECSEDEELVVEAKSVWMQPNDEGVLAGVAFTNRDAPAQVAESLGLEFCDDQDEGKPGSSSPRALRGVALIVGVAAVCYVALTWI